MSPRLRDVPAKRELRPRDYWQARVEQVWRRRARSGGLLGVWRAAWDADPYTEAEVRAFALDRILSGGLRERLAGADAETVRVAIHSSALWSSGHYGFHVQRNGRTWHAENGTGSVSVEITVRDLVAELRADRQLLLEPP